MAGFEMKRSDMQHQLMQLLVLCENNDLTYNKIADEILSLIEDRGMQPPYAEFKPLQQKVIGFDSGPKKIWANKWEPEDE